MGAVSTTEISRNQDHDRDVDQKHEGTVHIAAAIAVSPDYSHDAQDVTESQQLQGKLGSRQLCTTPDGFKVLASSELP